LVNKQIQYKKEQIKELKKEIEWFLDNNQTSNKAFKYLK
jgi:hypothetical protein